MLEAHSQAVPTTRAMTRTDQVHQEGLDAAYRGLPPHVNPYRSKSADGVAWRRGYDTTATKWTA